MTDEQSRIRTDFQDLVTRAKDGGSFQLTEKEYSQVITQIKHYTSIDDILNGRFKPDTESYKVLQSLEISMGSEALQRYESTIWSDSGMDEATLQALQIEMRNCKSGAGQSGRTQG